VPANFRNGKKSMIIVSLAGIITNLILAFVAAFFLYFFRFIIAPNVLWFYETENGIMLYTIISMVFAYLTTINITLAVFNLIPIPPLDGYKVFKELAIGKIHYNTFANLERYSTIILIIFLVLSDRLGIIGMLSNFVFSGIEAVMNLIFTAFI